MEERVKVKSLYGENRGFDWSKNGRNPYHADFQKTLRNGLLKALWEKEKMLVTSIFFFS